MTTTLACVCMALSNDAARRARNGSGDFKARGCAMQHRGAISRRGSTARRKVGARLRHCSRSRSKSFARTRCGALRTSSFERAAGGGVLDGRLSDAEREIRAPGDRRFRAGSRDRRVDHRMREWRGVAQPGGARVRVIYNRRSRFPSMMKLPGAGGPSRSPECF